MNNLSFSITMKRNINLDLLRLLGIIIIMIAHSQPPEWLFQLRNFGTPLLIVASALTYSFIYSKKEIKVNSFYRKRLKRLIFPPWIFLSFFFIFFAIIFFIFKKNYPFDIQTIIESFVFDDGIGSIWIFKVYIILALITPLTIYLNKKIPSDVKYYGLIILIYIFYEIANLLIKDKITGHIKYIFNNIVFLFVPYSILFLYGFRLRTMSKKFIIVNLVGSLITFTLLAIFLYIKTGEFVPTQNYKYPPTLYYLSYALFSTLLIYNLIVDIKFNNKIVKQSVIWLSSNSLWIYLWHIFANYLWKFALPNPDGDFLLFSAKAVFLLSFGLIATYSQHKLLSFMENKFSINPNTGLYTLFK